MTGEEGNGNRIISFENSPDAKQTVRTNLLIGLFE